MRTSFAAAIAALPLLSGCSDTFSEQTLFNGCTADGLMMSVNMDVRAERPTALFSRQEVDTLKEAIVKRALKIQPALDAAAAKLTIADLQAASPTANMRAFVDIFKQDGNDAPLPQNTTLKFNITNINYSPYPLQICRPGMDGAR
jgi:hypothetical protein